MTDPFGGDPINPFPETVGKRAAVILGGLVVAAIICLVVGLAVSS